MQCARFTAVSAFIAGYDEALHGGALVGFREWLLIGNKDWTNLPWWSLIRLRLNPKADLALPPSEEEETPLLGTLRIALEDFSKVYKAGGMPKVFHDYNTWLLSLSDPAVKSLQARLRATKPCFDIEVIFAKEPFGSERSPLMAAHTRSKIRYRAWAQKLQTAEQAKAFVEDAQAIGAVVRMVQGDG